MPRLSEVARHVVIPDGVETTGWPEVERWWADRGCFFDDWQKGLGSVALGKRADGKYAATVGAVTMSIPRQVGKTFVVGRIVVALCCIFDDMKWLWTAHRTRTSTQTFQSMAATVQKPGVKHLVKHIRQANGEQEIVFTNGSRILFGAREQGFGRGFDEVDGEVFDEAQILTEKALEDMVPAANQSSNPHGALVFMMGTPPRPIDPGEVFSNRRSKALSGKSTNGAYIEFSADEDADPDDWDQVATANPSFPDRTPREAIERMRELLGSDESFLREALGIWDRAYTGGVIPVDSWGACLDEGSLAVERLTLGLEVGPNLSTAAVALVGLREDGTAHLEIDEHRQGSEWLVGYVQALVDANPDLEVAGDVGGPLKAYVFERRGRYYLKGTKVEVHAPTVKELGVACMQLLNGVVTGQVFHIGQPQLTGAVQVAGKRPLGDTGMWVFSRKTAAADICPVLAVNSALWWVWSEQATKKRQRREGRKRDGKRRVVTA